MTEKIHVVLSTFQRPNLLKLCLNSIQNQNLSADSEASSSELIDLHVRVLINGVDHQSESIVRSFEKNSSAKLEVLCSNVKLNVGESRNQLIQDIQDGWIVFIDDDCILPVDYIHTLSKLIKRHPEASGFGGPNLGPVDEGIFEASNSFALSSFWGSGPFKTRYARVSEKKAKDSDLILCNLVLNRKLDLNFTLKIIAGEENILIRKLLKSKAILIYSSELSVHHHRRQNWKSLIEQITRYGVGRAEIIRAESSPAQLRLIKFALILSILALGIQTCLHLPLVTILLSLYLFANCLIVSFYSLFSVERFHPVLLFWNFLALHFFYPIGIVKGLLKVNR